MLRRNIQGKGKAEKNDYIKITAKTAEAILSGLISNILTKRYNENGVGDQA
ncbi:MAG: hypothetical protein LBN19_04730 [Endomicrobium sp.]|jgi:hypothetical protein|nr:hypothetical protein [Endomicrobium sp.]